MHTVSNSEKTLIDVEKLAREIEQFDDPLKKVDFAREKDPKTFSDFEARFHSLRTEKANFELGAFYLEKSAQQWAKLDLPDEGKKMGSEILNFLLGLIGGKIQKHGSKEVTTLSDIWDNSPQTYSWPGEPSFKGLVLKDPITNSRLFKIPKTEFTVRTPSGEKIPLQRPESQPCEMLGGGNPQKWVDAVGADWKLVVTGKHLQGTRTVWEVTNDLRRFLDLQVDKDTVKVTFGIVPDRVTHQLTIKKEKLGELHANPSTFFAKAKVSL